MQGLLSRKIYSFNIGCPPVLGRRGYASSRGEKWDQLYLGLTLLQDI